jgi:hypothetical protein
MKSGVKFLLLSIIPIILLTSIVSAIQPAPTLPAGDLSTTGNTANPFQELSNVFVGLLKVVGDFFGALTGANPLGLGELVFTRIMIFILLTCVLYIPAKIFAKQSTWIPLTISAIVALLGARFITEGMVTAILLPYGAVMITLSLLVPLILFTVLINTQDFPPWVRKLGWYLLFAAFLGLYIWRSKDLASEGRMIYVLFALAAIVGAIIDKKIYQKILETRLGVATSQQDVAAIEAEVDKLRIEKKGLMDRFSSLDPNAKIADRLKENGIWNQLSNLSAKVIRFEKALAQVKAAGKIK